MVPSAPAIVTVTGKPSLSAFTTEFSPKAIVCATATDEADAEEAAALNSSTSSATVDPDESMYAA